MTRKNSAEQAEKVSRKKGESLLISHAAFLAIGVTALIIISSMVWSLHDSVIREEARKDLSRASEAVANEIIKLYALKDSPAVPDANKTLLLGESSINTQQKAGGRQYSIELMGSGQIIITNISEGNVTKYASQIIASTLNPKMQVNYTLYNIDSRLQGYGFGDKPIALRYYRTNYNGTTEDRIILNNGLVISGEIIG